MTHYRHDKASTVEITKPGLRFWSMSLVLILTDTTVHIRAFNLRSTFAFQMENTGNLGDPSKYYGNRSLFCIT